MFFEVYGLDFKEGKLVGLRCFLLRLTKILSSQFREEKSSCSQMIELPLILHFTFFFSFLINLGDCLFFFFFFLIEHLFLKGICVNLYNYFLSSHFYFQPNKKVFHSSTFPPSKLTQMRETKISSILLFFLIPFPFSIFSLCHPLTKWTLRAFPSCHAKHSIYFNIRI